MYCFGTVAVETLGALGEEAFAFFCGLGHRIAAVTSDPRSCQLLQQSSVAVQLRAMQHACSKLPVNSGDKETGSSFFS